MPLPISTASSPNSATSGSNLYKPFSFPSLMKKSWLILLFILLPSTLALSFDSIWQQVLSIGDLSFLGLSAGQGIIAFTRILLWIAVFTLFFAVITTFAKAKRGNDALNFFNKNQAMVVSAVLATMVTIFLPPEVILGVSSGWATLVASLLIGLPVFGIIWLLWHIPFGGTGDTKFTVMVKLFLCLILFWILTVMKTYMGGIA